jgi:hypothetical protein
MLRNSFFPCRLCLLVTGLAAMIAVAPTSQAVDWLGKAYENHMEFSVMSRSYETSIGGGQPKRYVLLNARPGGPIVRPRPLTLPDGEVLAIAHGALTQAGFVAAGSAAEAEIAIVVHYAHGEYPPPFEFMGVDPVVVPSFRWPAMLQQYDQRYFRRNFSDAEHLGVVLSGAAKEGDLFNFIAIRAFDAKKLRDAKKWVLRWETRVTIDAMNRPLEKNFRAMILAASDSLGRNNRNGVTRSAPIRNGVVEIGELEVVGK